MDTEKTQDKALDQVLGMFAEKITERMIPENVTSAELINNVNRQFEKVGITGLVLLDDGKVGYEEKDPEKEPVVFPIF
jgi:hypothetical protein